MYLNEVMFVSGGQTITAIEGNHVKFQPNITQLSVPSDLKEYELDVPVGYIRLK